MGFIKEKQGRIMMLLLLKKDRNVWPLKHRAGDIVEVQDTIAVRWIAAGIAIEVNNQNKEGK